MATTTTINATQLGQSQKGLEADYYEMEAWETSSDDVSGSGNLNYQEVELKLDKELLDFGTGLDAVEDGEPALARTKTAEEASFFTQAEAAPVREMSQSDQPMMATGEGFSLGQLGNVQNIYTPPVTNLESSESIARASHTASAPDTATASGGVTTISSSEDGSTINIHNTYNGGCCGNGGGDTIINVDAVINHVINVGVDIINIAGDIINIGGDIINIDLGLGDGGDIIINPDITIDLGDVFESTIGVIVDLGDTITIGGNVNLDVIGIDVDTDIHLGIGDGINLDLDLGIGDLPLLGDALDNLLDIDLGLGDGGLSLDAEIIGGDLLDIDLNLGDGGLELGAGIGLPPLLGFDGWSLLDIVVDLGNGLGIDTDLLGFDLLDIGLLDENGLLNLELFGESLLGGDDVLGGLGDILNNLLGGGSDDLLGGITDTIGDVLGGLTGGGENPLEGITDVVDGLLGGGSDDPLGGITDTIGDVIGGLTGGGENPLEGITDVVDDLLGGGTDDLLGGITDTIDDVLGGLTGGGENPLEGITDVVDGLLGGGSDDPLGGITDTIGDVLGGLTGGGDGLGEILDVELLNDDGAIADIDLFGEDLLGDGGLLGELVGEDGILDGVTDDLGGALDLIDLELGGGDNGGLGIDLDIGGGNLLDVDLLGDTLLDINLGGNDLLGGDGGLLDGVGNVLDGVGDVLGGIGDALGGGGDCGGDALGGLISPVTDILPDLPLIPELPNLFGGWN